MKETSLFTLDILINVMRLFCIFSVLYVVVIEIINFTYHKWCVIVIQMMKENKTLSLALKVYYKIIHIYIYRKNTYKYIGAGRQ